MEKFSFAQTVARDCSDEFIGSMTANKIEDCGYDVPGLGIVFDLNYKCNEDGYEWEIGCYNNPSTENQVFNS